MVRYLSTANERTGRVPCKLNNVTNEKHQSSMSEEDMDMISCEPGFSQLPGLAANEFEASKSFNKVI